MTGMGFLLPSAGGFVPPMLLPSSLLSQPKFNLILPIPIQSCSAAWN
jgi:hypothetical protein